MAYYKRSRWAPYVPVAKRREQAAKKIKAAQKEGKSLNPITNIGRVIAKTFWGKAWCDNLENYSDYENRLPRGRTYVRNGSVIDLTVTKGKVEAQVMGAYLYKVTVHIRSMAENKWKTLVKSCSGKIDSLIELLQGKFSEAVMKTMITKEGGLFPKPQEIDMKCSCPDHAGMCKHIAAVLYGIGAAIDTRPEWLFTLRHVDHLELVASATTSEIINTSSEIQEGDLSDLFGIEIETPVSSLPKRKKPIAKGKASSKKSLKKAVAKTKAREKPKDKMV